MVRFVLTASLTLVVAATAVAGLPTYAQGGATAAAVTKEAFETRFKSAVTERKLFLSLRDITTERLSKLTSNPMKVPGIVEYELKSGLKLMINTEIINDNISGCTLSGSRDKVTEPEFIQAADIVMAGIDPSLTSTQRAEILTGFGFKTGAASTGGGTTAAPAAAGTSSTGTSVNTSGSNQINNRTEINNNRYTGSVFDTGYTFSIRVRRGGMPGRFGH